MEGSERIPAELMRMLLGLGVGRGCASRFSLSRSLRIVICGGERDWKTEEADDEWVF